MAQGAVGVNILSKIVELGGSNVSAFGDIITVSPVPLVQLDYTYGINTQTGASTTANGGTVDVSLARLRLQTSTATNGSAIFYSKRIARYKPGQGMQARFTGAWDSNAANATQIIGAGTANDGYFFGYNGTSFGILRRKGGNDNWVPQADWNEDTCDGNGASGFDWDQTLANVMQIRYPYLGYGNVTFWVQNPANSTWILCHTIKYTNSSQLLQIDNPSVRFYAQVINSGNSTNLIMYSGSCNISLTGNPVNLGARWAYDNAKTVSTENCVFNLQNCTTYNGVANYGVATLKGISACYANNANSYAVIRLKKSVTIGGSPSYTPINGSTADNGVTLTSANSIMSYDTAGTTVTGGVYLWQMNMCQGGNAFFDLSNFNLQVRPGEILTVSAFASNSATVSVGLNWEEDV